MNDFEFDQWVLRYEGRRVKAGDGAVERDSTGKLVLFELEGGEAAVFPGNFVIQPTVNRFASQIRPYLGNIFALEGTEGSIRVDKPALAEHRNGGWTLIDPGRIRMGVG